MNEILKERIELGTKMLEEADDRIAYLNTIIKDPKTDVENGEIERTLASTYAAQSVISERLERAYHKKNVAQTILKKAYLSAASDLSDEGDFDVELNFLNILCENVGEKIDKKEDLDDQAMLEIIAKTLTEVLES